jgi:hypothetical protein
MEANSKAQDLKDSGHLREARAQLLVCIQKNCNSVIRSDCEKWLKEVDEQTPSLTVRVVDSRGHDVIGVRVTIDDALIEMNGTPVQVDPGQRVIKARAKSGDVAEQKTLVAQGEKGRVIEVKFDTALAQDGTKDVPAPTEPERPKPTTDESEALPVIPITLAVIGGVALGAFIFFEARGQSGFSDLVATCKPHCTDAQQDPVKSDFLAAGISLSVAVAGLAAATIVYFARKPSSNTTYAPISPVIRF